MRRPVRATALTALGCAVAGCAVAGCSTISEYRFTIDHRLKITAPKDNSTVGLPLTITWSTKDLAPGSNTFAVFVDRQPVKPGQPISAVAKDDRECAYTPGCPDTTYYNQHGVFLTPTTSITVPHIQSTKQRSTDATHDAIVVLIDSRGRRAGESAFEVDFRLQGDK